MQRRISLERDFMDWHKDDIMYAFLVNLAEYRKQDNVLWLAKVVYYDYRDEIMDKCGYSSPTSLRNNMKKWLSSGLIEEGKVKQGQKTLDAYIFKNQDKNGRYQLVNIEILKRLVATKTKHSIQIYTYLLSKFKFKRNYEFTFEELRDMLGYAEKRSHNVEQNIKYILQDLQKTGYIDYELSYVQKDVGGRTITVPKKTLTFVAMEESEIKFKQIG